MAAYLARRGRRAKVLIFDANNHFPRQDAFSAAWQELYPGTIEWIPVTEGGALERVDPERMTLFSPRGAQRAGLALQRLAQRDAAGREVGFDGVPGGVAGKRANQDVEGVDVGDRPVVVDEDRRRRPRRSEGQVFFRAVVALFLTAGAFLTAVVDFTAVALAAVDFFGTAAFLTAAVVFEAVAFLTGAVIFTVAAGSALSLRERVVRAAGADAGGSAGTGAAASRCPPTARSRSSLVR